MTQDTLRPFYFTAVLWGEVYRRYFTDFMVASLLSPNNIPALNPERKSKFLIVTTGTDWEALQSEPVFQKLTQYVEPVWFEMPVPSLDDSKMLVMSKGHERLTARAFADRAYGVFFTPDAVLSDGSVAAMERLADAGKKVVLSVAIRFQHETLIEEMKRHGYFKHGGPLALPPRDLMRMALQHLHTETLRYQFEAPYFAEKPFSVYWSVPGGDGVIIYSFSWAPLLVDYGTIDTHDLSTFLNWTMDGDYIYRNFPDPHDAYIVKDSDEIVLVSLTKETDYGFDLNYDPRKARGGQLETICKVGRIRSLWESPITDPLKRTLFPQPVYLHSSEISRTWKARRSETDQVIAQVLLPRTIEQRFIADSYERAGQGRLSDWIFERVIAVHTSGSQAALWGLIGLWIVLIRPSRIVLSVFRKLLSPMRWLWRYRRFVWWRVKEKLGLAAERRFDWRKGEWDQPSVSLVCPLYTAGWLWRHRRQLRNEFRQRGFTVRHALEILRSWPTETR